MNKNADRPSRSNILGINVSVINIPAAVAVIEGWIDRCEPNYVCVTPAHAVMDCYNQPQLKDIFNASGLTTPDGMSIVWILRLRGYKNVSRVYGPDLMLAVCRRSAERGGYRHFLYGGAPGVAEKLAEELLSRFPGLTIAGTYAPPFRPLTAEEDQEITALINASQPDIVWVGISSPKQELWMAEHLGRISAPVLIGVGAAFDFLSGVKPQAPRWVQRSGMEWLFRLATEPRRLWRRYIQYPLFLLLVLAQMVGIKRYVAD